MHGLSKCNGAGRRFKTRDPSCSRGRDRWFFPFLFAFPAELSLNPVNWYGPPDAVPVLLRVEDPVQHFLYHFDLDDVRLADYIIEPRTGIP